MYGGVGSNRTSDTMFWYTITTSQISHLINIRQLEDIEGSLEVPEKNQEACFIQSDLRPDYA